jgi:hypothetical protein
MSIFLDKVGDTPSLRILEYFLEFSESDHAVGDVLECIGMSRSTFYAVWPVIIANEYVVISKTVGKTRLYKLNTKNTYVLLFIQIFDAAMKEKPKRHKMTA